MYPSIKTLQTIAGDRAKDLRAIIDGTADPKRYENVEAWVRQCFHEPTDLEQRIEAANQILDGFGVEALQCMNVHGAHYEPHAVYVNMGDTYTGTLVYDYARDRWLVTSWGDFVESEERRRGGCRFD
jgi:hypothetical protein